MTKFTHTIKALPKIWKIPDNKKLQIMSEKLTTSEIHLGKNTELNLIVFLKKGWDKNQEQKFILEGENSKINFTCAIMGKGKNNFSFQTTSQHKAKNTKADFLVRAVLFDESKVNYLGNIQIEKGAEMSSAHLSHDSLILSEKAKTKTTPSLEIKADNVKAGHSATIGKIDENIIFYMQTRGLNTKNCKKLIIENFIKSCLTRKN
ncbi:SufD family Fe-S cluster assembly protein [Candidatus Peregrinibacteria bacterium]|nr:SufD family Fe-S cluster assembly protein [Candidatus Peregrinibacteria bacterium]